jgi:hypothetical protein
MQSVREKLGLIWYTFRVTWVEEDKPVLHLVPSLRGELPEVAIGIILAFSFLESSIRLYAKEAGTMRIRKSASGGRNKVRSGAKNSRRP